MENNNTLMTDAEWLTDDDREVKKDYLEKIASYASNSKNPENDYNLSKFFDEYNIWFQNFLGRTIEDDFKPGASKEELDNLEKLIGYLDDDVRELYSLHNGNGCKGDLVGLFGFEFLSIAEIIKCLNNQGRLPSDNKYIANPDNKIHANVFNYGWLPIMADSSGNFIGVDYYPTENGTVGQVINFGRDEDKQYVFAPSLKEFLKYLMELTKIDGMYEVVKFDDVNVVGYNVDGERYMHLTEFLMALINQKLGMKTKTKKKIMAKEVSSVEQTSEDVESEPKSKAKFNWRDYQTITINGTTLSSLFTLQNMLDAGAIAESEQFDTIEPGLTRECYWLEVDNAEICVMLYNPEKSAIDVADGIVFMIQAYSLIDVDETLDNSITIGLIENNMSYNDIRKIYGDADEFYNQNIEMITPDDISDLDIYWVMYGTNNSGDPGYMDINACAFKVTKNGVIKVTVTYYEQITEVYGFLE